MPISCTTSGRLTKRIAQADNPPDEKPYGWRQPDRKKYRYYVANYPRADQQPAPGCELEDTEKNHDDFDTWNGFLVGTKQAIAETLVKWGVPALVLQPISLEDALDSVEESAESDE